MTKVATFWDWVPDWRILRLRLILRSHWDKEEVEIEVKINIGEIEIDVKVGSEIEVEVENVKLATGWEIEFQIDIYEILVIEDEKVEIVPLSEIEMVDSHTLLWDWIEHVSNNIANEEIEFLAFITILIMRMFLLDYWHWVEIGWHH